MKKKRKSRFQPPAQSLKKIYLLIGCIVVVFVLAFASLYGFKLYKEYTAKPTKLLRPDTTIVTLDQLKVEMTSVHIFVSDEVKYESDRIIVRIVDGPEVVFSTVQDVKVQVALLSQILTKLSIDNKKPTHIDLHFSKPIVKF